MDTTYRDTGVFIARLEYSPPVFGDVTDHDVDLAAFVRRENNAIRGRRPTDVRMRATAAKDAMSRGERALFACRGVKN